LFLVAAALFLGGRGVVFGGRSVGKVRFGAVA